MTCNNQVPHWIDRLQSLKSFDMQGNQLTDLPLTFRELTKVSRLNLAGEVLYDSTRLLISPQKTVWTLFRSVFQSFRTCKSWTL